MRTCLVAGRGRLPHLLAGAVPGLHLAALEGFAPDRLGPVETFRVETLGTFIAGLAARGVRRVCFAGGVRRPDFDPRRVDAATLPLLPRLAAAMGQGDDAGLRVVLALFEEAGIAPVGAHELLPSLLPEAGMLAGEAGDEVRADAARAAGIVAALGAADVGQSCIVARGQALAVEAAPGTDWMLASVAAARRGAAATPGAATVTSTDGPPEPDWFAASPRGGVLFKGPKPGQDRRVDLPAIGPESVIRAAAAGLDGIVVEADGVMLLDRAEAVERARAHGLFLWVRGAEA